MTNAEYIDDLATCVDARDQDGRDEQHDQRMGEKRAGHRRAIGKRHRERDAVVAHQWKGQRPESAAIGASYHFVEQRQAAEVHDDAFEAMNVGSAQR